MEQFPDVVDDYFELLSTVSAKIIEKNFCLTDICRRSDGVLLFFISCHKT